MLDHRQNNEPFYYNVDQIQKTNGNQLRDIEERHGEIRQLETNIVQLHEIHRDLSEIVSGHGEMIDNIESSVAQTERQTVAGTKNLAKTVQIQTAVRRKKILCGTIGCIVIIIIIIVILLVSKVF